MNEPHQLAYTDFVLPPSVVSKVDISRLVSDFERVDSELTTIAVRAKTGVKQSPKLSLSAPLAEFLNQNNLRPKGSRERSELIAVLHQLKDNAPVIHLTFAAEADQTSLEQLTQWVRTSIHPQAVLSVGVQPALVAGVYLRTPNRVHDLSLRGALEQGREILTQELGALRGRV